MNFNQETFKHAFDYAIAHATEDHDEMDVPTTAETWRNARAKIMSLLERVHDVDLPIVRCNADGFAGVRTTWSHPETVWILILVFHGNGRYYASWHVEFEAMCDTESFDDVIIDRLRRLSQ